MNNGSDPGVRTLVVVIPAYRAAARLPRVLDRVRRAVPSAALLVVDDGSDDATASAAAAAAAEVLSHPRNLGKGRALATGLEAALARGATLLVTLDADGQHPPESIPDLLAPILEGHADLVIGSRRPAPDVMPLGRRATNWLSSRLLSRAVGRPVPDSQSGFRALRAAVARSVRPAGRRYEYETEFLFLAAAHGFRMAAVEIPTLYDGAPSHFRYGGDTLALAAVFLRYWRPILRGPPER